MSAKFPRGGSKPILSHPSISLEIDKCKSKNAALVSEVLALLSWSSKGYILNSTYTIIANIEVCFNRRKCVIEALI